MQKAQPNETITKQELIEHFEEEIILKEEQHFLDSIEDGCYEYLTEHDHDYWEDTDSILKAFIENYRPSFVRSIINFGAYESDEALAIVKLFKGREEELCNILLENSYQKQDYDIYHRHWNDLSFMPYEEYEVQVDRDDAPEEYQAYFELINKDHAFLMINIGAVRLKLNAEEFERQLSLDHGIRVNELDLEEKAV